MAVKQNAAELMRVNIRLRDHMDSQDAFGVEEGRIVHARLLKVVEHSLGQAPGSAIVFAISIEGVRRTDASFPRESVMQLAHRFRPEHGFCLWHLDDPVLLENWEAGANRRVQPMLLWRDTPDGFQTHLLGPRLTESLRNVLEILIQEARRPIEISCDVAAADVATKLGLSISNASNKLKVLWTEGYILRREQIAPSGGIEFRYFVAR